MNRRASMMAVVAATLIYGIGSTLVLLTAETISAAFDYPAQLIAGAYLCLGLLSGWSAGSVRQGVLAIVLWSAALSLAAYVYTSRMTGVLALTGDFTPAFSGAPGITWEMLWASCLFVGHVSVGWVGMWRGKKGKRYKVPKDSDVRAYAEANGLILTQDEVRGLRSRPGGSVCKICREDYADDTEDWTERWMRCRANGQHLFHVKHFGHCDWRCPVCRKPVVPPS